MFTRILPSVIEMSQFNSRVFTKQSIMLHNVLEPPLLPSAIVAKLVAEEFYNWQQDFQIGPNLK